MDRGGFSYENARKTMRVRSPLEGRIEAIWRLVGGVRRGGEKVAYIGRKSGGKGVCKGVPKSVCKCVCISVGKCVGTGVRKGGGRSGCKGVGEGV